MLGFGFVYPDYTAAPAKNTAFFLFFLLKAQIEGCNTPGEHPSLPLQPGYRIAQVLFSFLVVQWNHKNQTVDLSAEQAGSDYNFAQGKNTTKHQAKQYGCHPQIHHPPSFLTPFYERAKNGVIICVKMKRNVLK
ncbi:MAG: hypothetical protein J6Q99_03045 [Oscillospiraceae bacterium]|nr:hypothetical protein [Oscillospiraceae bacterium]